MMAAAAKWGLKERGGFMPTSVRIPVQLRTLTGGQEVITGTGGSVLEIIEDIDRQYPGLKDRICESEGEGSAFRQHLPQRGGHSVPGESPDPGHRKGRTVDHSGHCRRIGFVHRTCCGFPLTAPVAAAAGGVSVATPSWPAARALPSHRGCSFRGPCPPAAERPP